MEHLGFSINEYEEIRNLTISKYTQKALLLRNDYRKYTEMITAKYDKTLKSTSAEYKAKKRFYLNILQRDTGWMWEQYEKIKHRSRTGYLRAKYTNKDLPFDKYAERIRPVLSEYNKIEQKASATYHKELTQTSAEYSRGILGLLSNYITTKRAALKEYDDELQRTQDEYKTKKQEAWLELCPEHENKIKAYYEKWLAVGLRTNPLDREKACALIKSLYRKLGKREPNIFIFGSPLSCLYGIDKSYALKRQFESNYQIQNQLWEHTSEQILPRKDSLTALVAGKQVGLQINSKIRDRINSWTESRWIDSQAQGEVELEVQRMVESQIWLRIENQIWTQISNQMNALKNETKNWWYGNHNCYWVGVYEFYRDILGFRPRHPALFEHVLALTQELHWFLPYEDEACILSDFPVEIHRNQNGALHKDGGPALRYSDGFSLWMLNGIRVKRSIIETPADKLDARLVSRETNTEVRREIVRKIGIEKVCRDLNAECVDKQGNYELLLLDIGDNRKRTYLKMINPSIGVYHIEGVGPGIRTVRHALAWRNQSDKKPEQIT